MENSCLLSLLEKFRKGDMSVFPVVFSEFEGLIYHYAEKSDAEDTAEELSVFLLELLYKIDLSPFMGGVWRWAFKIYCRVYQKQIYRLFHQRFQLQKIKIFKSGRGYLLHRRFFETHLFKGCF